MRRLNRILLFQDVWIDVFPTTQQLDFGMNRKLGRRTTLALWHQSEDHGKCPGPMRIHSRPLEKDIPVRRRSSADGEPDQCNKIAIDSADSR